MAFIAALTATFAGAAEAGAAAFFTGFHHALWPMPGGGGERCAGGALMPENGGPPYACAPGVPDPRADLAGQPSRSGAELRADTAGEAPRSGAAASAATASGGGGFFQIFFHHHPQHTVPSRRAKKHCELARFRKRHSGC